MCRTRTRAGSVPDRLGRLAVLATGWLLVGGGLVSARQATNAPAQAPAPVVSSPAPVATAPVLSPTPTDLPSAPGTSVAESPAAEPEKPVLPHEIQVVRFIGPDGVKLEVLGPTPEAIPTGDGKGLATLGMKVGVGYRLRLSGIPNRPEAELYPVAEVVGHLHRPSGIDPAKFPIRVAITEEDIAEVVDKGRLVTIAGYLEDPDQALPLKLNKDEPASVAVSPAEDPLRVASALGRVMVVIRMGARKPTPDEITLPAGDGLASGPCPFTQPSGGRCTLPCGPVCGTPPPPNQPWIPRDEFLCDGGDRAEPVHFGGDGGLRGIDPRDAVITFRDDKRPRVLPTNTVCIYAPRFAAVRASVGPNETLNVTEIRSAERLQKGAMAESREGTRKLLQRQVAEANRHRSRASGLAGRVYAGQHSELRVLNGYDSTVHIAGHVRIQGPEKMKQREKAAGLGTKVKVETFNRPEAVVLTGIIEGPSQTVMTWNPQSVTGIEEPAKKPGIAVEKTVDVAEAEPGDVLTFTIAYRNMGNTPLKAATIVDSLMPRLEYVKGSAKGPAGTIFTMGENRAGSVELRWDLPGTVAPGANGFVSFQAVVR